MTLKFSEKAHRYWLDGKPVPSVTTLLKGGLANDALMYWSARTVAEYVADNPDEVSTLAGLGREPMIAALKAIPWQKRDEAAVRGTDIHAIAESVVYGSEVEVAAELAPFVETYVDFLDEFEVEPLLTERSVASREYGYAGRFDLIARIDGETWLLDNKTSKGVYGSTALQLAAYANAEFYVDDDDPETEKPLPTIDRLGVVHISPFATELRPVDSAIGDPFADFLAVAAVSRRKKAIDSYLAEALTRNGALSNV